MSTEYARRRYAAQLRNKAGGYILRPTFTDNGRGSLSVGEPERIGPIAYTLRAASGREVNTDEQLQERGAYRLKLPFDTSLLPGDLFEAAGQAYKIMWRPPLQEDSYLLVLGVDLATPATYGD